MQWRLGKALDVARVRVDYEKLLPKQRKPSSVFVHLAAGYRKSFCHGDLPLYSTVFTVEYSPITG